MAVALPTLTFGTYTNGLNTVITGSEPVLESIAGTNDTTYVYDATNSTHTGLAWFTIADMPEDFYSMVTLSINVRYAWATGTQRNTWGSIQAQIYKSDQTTALTNNLTVVSNITTTTATNSGAVAMSGISSSVVRADWDGAYLALRWGITKVSAGDTLQKRIYAAELTGTYNPTGESWFQMFTW